MDTMDDRERFESEMLLRFGHLSLKRDGYTSDEPYSGVNVNNLWALWQAAQQAAKAGECICKKDKPNE